MHHSNTLRPKTFHAKKRKTRTHRLILHVYFVHCSLIDFKKSKSTDKNNQIQARQRQEKKGVLRFDFSTLNSIGCNHRALMYKDYIILAIYHIGIEAGEAGRTTLPWMWPGQGTATSWERRRRRRGREAPSRHRRRRPEQQKNSHRTPSCIKPSETAERLIMLNRLSRIGFWVLVTEKLTLI